MKLSGHNFNNGVFDSLLNGISKDIELKKTAQVKEEPKVDEFFSSTTQSDFDSIQREELDFIANELHFAAGRAKVNVGAKDLAQFATQVQREGLRGKALERAAQKYCGKLHRDESSPIGTTRLSAGELIDQLSPHKVISAGYNPEIGANNSKTGKFIGSSKNPNTIWDTDALQRQSQIALGDEKIKASKQAQETHKLAMKTAQWEELQKTHSSPGQLNKGITNAGTSEVEEVVNQKMPVNSMSIFSSDRDFSNIPDRTLGESIIAEAEARANKKASSKEEQRDIQKPMNTRNALDSLFGG